MSCTDMVWCERCKLWVHWLYHNHEDALAAAQPDEWAYCTVCKKYECICAEPEEKL